ncbi:MAG TPA: hypothetical protein VEC39_17270 [Vicinamibacterales bacterium]|nr:hypothetical protein [Vicinamibacterales bacterium]
MRTGKTSAATLGLVGGLALGAWIGAEMTQMRAVKTAEPAAVATQAVEEPAAPAAPAKTKRVARVARAASGSAAAEAPAPESAPKLVMTIPVSAPEFQARMKPVLARGTKLPLAVEGFTDAEQFAALARASRNTKVPFILLKHRVLTEGKSLEEAIRESNPDIDARTEALRAKGEARADILSVTANNSPSIAATTSSNN